MTSTPDVNAREPAVTIVVPTVGRPNYLDVALRSLLAQDVQVDFEVIVVADGVAAGTADLAARHGARLVSHDTNRGLNAARNSGTQAARGELVAFVDDDIEAREGWLHAVVAGAGAFSDAEAFTGPIRPRFEQPPPSGCGRDRPLITALDLGDHDRATTVAWGANLIVRRSAFERVGSFDETIRGGGDEEEWLERLRHAGGRIVYLAEAAVDHRRTREDVRLGHLAGVAFRRGIAARAFDARRGRAPTIRQELRTFAGCVWHTARRRCPRGVIMAASAAGRLVGAARSR
jgi:glycosyltransferase involved in cell wall biosynthesis